MVHLVSSSFTLICRDVAGIAGNIFAFGLFLSPIPTFRRIVRNKSTEQFSGLPYIYALLNCLICMWYGTPFVSSNNTLVMTVNTIGTVFQSVYTVIFIIYASKGKKINMIGLLLAVAAIFAAVVICSLQILGPSLRRNVVGTISAASLISMCASPLMIINLVIRTGSVEYMPFFLSLSTFLMSTSFFIYGCFNDDLFIYIPNGVGAILGSIQLILYFYFKFRGSPNTSREPLIETHT